MSNRFLTLSFFTTTGLFLILIGPLALLFLTISPESLVETIKDGEVWDSIITSLKGALLSTTAGILLGVPTAYWLSETNFKGKRTLEALLNLPIVIPHVAVGIVLLKATTSLRIPVADTIYGVALAMFFVSVSYIVSSSLIGFQSVNRELIWTARSLGATPFQAFRWIIFPNALPSIARGALLAFARSLSEVGALLILAYYPKTAPILMYERFENYGLSNALPITVIIIAISSVIFIALLKLSDKERLSA